MDERRYESAPYYPHLYTEQRSSGKATHRYGLYASNKRSQITDIRRPANHLKGVQSSLSKHTMSTQDDILVGGVAGMQDELSLAE